MHFPDRTSSRAAVTVKQIEGQAMQPERGI